MKRCHFSGRACVTCYQWPPPIFPQLTVLKHFSYPMDNFPGQKGCVLWLLSSRGRPDTTVKHKPSGSFPRKGWNGAAQLSSVFRWLLQAYTKAKKWALPRTVLSSSTVQNLNSVLRHLRTSSFFLVLKLGESDLGRSETDPGKTNIYKTLSLWGHWMFQKTVL